MLARELLNGREPPLHLLLPRTVELERLAIALELARSLAHVHGGLLQQG